MDATLVEKLERLASLSIRLVPVPGLARHYVFERGGFAALVERREDDGFGQIGSAGLLTDKGLSLLVWRGAEAYFVARDFKEAAQPDQVRALRDFSADLERALKS